MKHIEVVAAIIIKDNSVLATQRGYGEFEGGWEFPGGKIEEGETPELALVREIHEELNATIEVQQHLVTINYDYPTFSLTMGCYVSKLKSKIELLEHNAARWLNESTIDEVEWLPADIEVVNAIKANGLLD